MSNFVEITPIAPHLSPATKAGCVLLNDHDVRVLVDPGHFESRAVLEAALWRSSATCLDDIDMIYFTHLHFDRYNDLGFADVPLVLIPRREKIAIEELMSPRWDKAAYAARIRDTHLEVAPAFMRQFFERIDDARYDFENVSFSQQLCLIDADKNITHGLRTVGLPGHPIGQLGLAMKTQHGYTLVAGDAVMSLEDYQQADAGAHDAAIDTDGLTATRRRLAEFDCVVPGYGEWFNPRTGQLLAAMREGCNV